MRYAEEMYLPLGFLILAIVVRNFPAVRELGSPVPALAFAGIGIFGGAIILLGLCEMKNRNALSKMLAAIMIAGVIVLFAI